MKLKNLLNEENELESDEAKTLRHVSHGNIRVNANGQYYTQYDLTIDIERNAALFYEMVQQAGGNKLRHKLEMVIGNFYCGDCDLVSFENFPFDVKKDLDAWGNEFTSLEGITPHIGGELSLSHNNGLTSFTGVGKYVKSCKRLIVPGVLKSHLLGTIMIKRLESLTTSDDEISPEQCPELSEALRVINRHLGGSQDLFDAKEELMTNGKYNLKEFAKL